MQSDAIPSTPHLRGTILVILSALLFSTAGLFAKGIAEEAWTIVFWRGLTAAAFIFGFLVATGRIRAEIAAFTRPALAVTLVRVTGSACFIASFKLTSVANVALIYAAVPFLAAAIAWATLRERPSGATLAGSCASLAGVALIVGGSVGGGTLGGDLLALWMTFTLAIEMVIYRRWPDTVVATPTALSSLLLVPIALAFGDPLSADPGNILAMAAFGLLFILAAIALSAGSRLLPSAEAGLLSALETPLGPIWAYLFLAEVPPRETVIGGAIILSAIVLAQQRNTRTRLRRT
ncbi:DMT family transporter [Nisaea sediminum]|uniref:DMT family transporter n=1 Tax=Nisaea sediminum TaxID=2775867 RepID=UPI0018683BA3|nr:DMT family transporter [Nisaea sediminum]